MERDNRSVGGGATFDMATHAIDLANYFFHVPKVDGSNLIKIYSKMLRILLALPSYMKMDYVVLLMLIGVMIVTESLLIK